MHSYNTRCSLVCSTCCNICEACVVAAGVELSADCARPVGVHLPRLQATQRLHVLIHTTQLLFSSINGQLSAMVAGYILWRPVDALVISW